MVHGHGGFSQSPVTVSHLRSSGMHEDMSPVNNGLHQGPRSQDAVIPGHGQPITCLVELLQRVSGSTGLVQGPGQRKANCPRSEESHRDSTVYSLSTGMVGLVHSTATWFGQIPGQIPGHLPGHIPGQIPGQASGQTHVNIALSRTPFRQPLGPINNARPMESHSFCYLVDWTLRSFGRMAWLVVGMIGMAKMDGSFQCGYGWLDGLHYTNKSKGFGGDNDRILEPTHSTLSG